MPSSDHIPQGARCQPTHQSKAAGLRGSELVGFVSMLVTLAAPQSTPSRAPPQPPSGQLALFSCRNGQTVSLEPKQEAEEKRANGWGSLSLLQETVGDRREKDGPCSPALVLGAHQSLSHFLNSLPVAIPTPIPWWQRPDRALKEKIQRDSYS